MQIDITTEEVWHFIGSFHQITEAARGRASYDAYKAQQAKPAEGDLTFLNTTYKAPYKAGDFQPGMQIEAPAEPQAALLIKAPARPHDAEALTGPLPPLPLLPEIEAPMQIGPPTGAPYEVLFALPPPASVALIFGQLNLLSDQDIQIQHDFGITFAPFSTSDGPMAALLETADALDQLGDYDHPSDVAAIKAIGWQVAQDITTMSTGDHAALIEGSAVSGVHINGAAADAMPALADHLPDVPEPVSVPPGSTWEDQVSAEASVPPAHIAVTGGNALVNEVVLTVSWLDAPVMLVQGDALSISVISQINVMSGQLDASFGAAAQSAMINAALHGVTAGPLPEVPAETAGIFPTSWIITTLHADLIQCNWMTQQNFVIDHDVLSLTWSGGASFLRLGDNSLLNIAELLELGWGYDLIVIGGDMINVSMIRQMNVLLDADWVAMAGGEVTLTAGGNLLWNSAQITGTGLDGMLAMDAYHADLAEAVMTGTTGAIPLPVSNAAFEGGGTLSVLYITGDFLTLNMIDQTNILGDADQVAALATEATYANGAEVAVISGANSLVNLATIDTIGVDSDIHVAGEIYSDALIYQANFIDEGAVDPYAAQGPAALASEAVLFLADGMLADEDAPPVFLADAALNSGQLDGVNAVLV
ncbi:MAG: hypothetical protein MUE83_00400 [Tabrizicola sp.]|nr:hypothetical protein [Tabrizicola sp.]